MGGIPPGTGRSGLGSPGRGFLTPGLPSPHPRPRLERPPLTQQRRDTDCAEKAALLRRAAAEAAGGAGGTARETPRSVGPEPLPWGGPHRQLGSAPAPRPGEGTGRPHCPGPPLSGAPHRGKIGTPSSAGRLGETKERGRSVPRDRSPKPGTIRGSATRFLPTPTWARGRLSLRGRNPIGALTAPAPQLRSQLSWGFFGEVGAPIPQSRGLPGARHAPCLPPPQSTPPLQPTTPDVIPHPLQELIPPPTINVPQSSQYPSMQSILSSPSLRGCRPVT